MNRDSRRLRRRQAEEAQAKRKAEREAAEARREAAEDRRKAAEEAQARRKADREAKRETDSITVKSVEAARVSDTPALSQTEEVAQT